MQELWNEIRHLRRGDARGDAAACEALLRYLADSFGSKPWTAATVFEAMVDKPFLRGAIVRCIGEELSIPRFSRFLSVHCGRWGVLELRCVNRHSREGARFTVTKSVTSLHSRRASVTSTDL